MLSSGRRRTNEKRDGVSGLFFFFIAGSLAILMRLQLLDPDNDFMTNPQFNSTFTMHGTTMVFMAGMPIIFGFANYLVPLQIGARDLAFPRLNALSFWLLPTGALVVYAGYFAGGVAAGPSMTRAESFQPRDVRRKRSR